MRWRLPTAGLAGARWKRHWWRTLPWRSIESECIPIYDMVPTFRFKPGNIINFLITLRKNNANIIELFWRKRRKPRSLKSINRWFSLVYQVYSLTTVDQRGGKSKHWNCECIIKILLRVNPVYSCYILWFGWSWKYLFGRDCCTVMKLFGII